MGMRAPASGPTEVEIVRLRALGELSADDAFERLYALYAAPVMSWLRLRVRAADAEDLFQDIWRIFHGRCSGWKTTPERETPDARPVLAFLFRTCHLVLMGHRRAARPTESLDRLERGGPDPAGRLDDGLVLGRCLTLARERCTAR